MAEGEKAAKETKGAFSAIGEMGEDVRKNVNSFADELLGGNKSTHHPSGGTGDIHPDAKKAGDSLQKGVDDAGRKLDEAMNKHH
ncbi:hypothetical protein BAUCODRAFT_151697 [Baudoinia panamericana UAMH 10762]|uniref:Uncharacterized protein n=1 Tax=Baudoinia panamericana (strain UAMH 10762) TaxID=717646 RepID=M2LE72_BAUPA|nr:uncharacterized protein BAUCODRAFT_151697 [Baudoinia panamericana UAMH 10762]EMC92282.1 hypothetical protein BAUCODRAFT_151697 [Baudoinia panamericana UAMH 10762]